MAKWMGHLVYLENPVSALLLQPHKGFKEKASFTLEFVEITNMKNCVILLIENTPFEVYA